MTQTDRRWRTALIAFCGLCALLFAINVASGSLTASEGFDFQLQPTAQPYYGRIEGVVPGSPADRSGLRNGDIVPFAALQPEDRYRLLSGVYGHERLRIVVRRDGVDRTIGYVSGPAVPQTRWDLILGEVSVVWALMFALLLAWRCPQLPEARVLCVFLAINWINGYTSPGDWASRSLPLDFVFALLAFVTMSAATSLVAYYAGFFARPLSPLRKTLAVLSYASAAAGAVFSAVFVFGRVYGVLQPFSGNNVAGDVIAASWLFAFLALIAAVAASRGAERGRIVWTTVSLAPIMLASIPYNAGTGVLGLGVSGAGYSVLTQVLNVGAFLSPIGMSYALLNRRLLDFGFALNRAAVYTGVSVVVVGVFVLVEYVISEWLGAGRANIAAGALLALGLGFSMRFIHARVDQVLDTVFFKKRHEDERAIRDFAHEVAYITEARTVLERVRSLLSERADAAWVGVEIADESGSIGPADENDPAIVSMRAWHKRVDLHGVATALQGEFAYPMVARARLVGVLVLGPKRSGEPYAPDESDAIAHLAHGAGLALDNLSLRAERSEVLDAIREVRDSVVEAIGELKQSIVPSPML